MTCKGMVERDRLARQCARGVGMVMLVFSLTVAALLTVDEIRSGHAETVRSEVLVQALAQSRAAPEQEEAVHFAREMDLLARRAYFSSLTFRQGGMALLVLGLLVTAGCFGVAWRLSLRIPDPRGVAETDPGRMDRLSVTAVLAGGLALLLVAGVLNVWFGRQAPSASDSALRARLTNQALQPGERNVCPCRLGTQPDEMEGQWPFMLGPTMSGRASGESAPLNWNGATGEGIRWKTPLDKGGVSTPVVWGQRLFLTVGSAASRAVIAYDTESGAKLWRTEIPDGARGNLPLPEVMEETGYAAPTPACDRERVYAIFATGDVVALDHEGRLVWQVFLGRPNNTYGHASSLVYSGAMLIVQWDQRERSRILALDTATGRTLWETPRDHGMSWSTPLILPVSDGFQLLVHASHSTWGMELATGRKLWEAESVSGEVAPSLAWEGDVWVAANIYSRMVAFKLPPGGEPQQLWEWDRGSLPDVASPVIADGLVFMVNDAGDVRCHELATGAEIWHKEFDDGFYASPVVVGGRLYVVDRAAGVFRVFSADREGRELAVNPMGEGISATPAFAGGRIYVRGQQNLWAIEGTSGAP